LLVTPLQLLADEHRISGQEFQTMANMDVQMNSNYHHQQQNLVETFKSDRSGNKR